MTAITGLRAFSHDQFPLDVLRARGASVSVCIPAQNERETIAGVLAPLIRLLERELVDQIIVIDSASNDGTAATARAAGAEVLDAQTVVPDLGSVQGKGDAVWRSIDALRGDVIVLLDADLQTVNDGYVRGLAGPLLVDPALQLVKGSFNRLIEHERAEQPVGGGRVTELLARPVLSLFYPELASLRQPLSGQVGVRREWLETLPIWTGYGLEIGMLLETWKRAGLEAIAEADLGQLRNRSQPLSQLGPMAYAVLTTVARHLEREGRLDPVGVPPFKTPTGTFDVAPLERPPHASVSAAP